MNLESEGASILAQTSMCVLFSTGFLKQVAVVARGLGLPYMAIAEFPGVPITQSKEELRGKK